MSAVPFHAGGQLATAGVPHFQLGIAQHPRSAWRDEVDGLAVAADHRAEVTGQLELQVNRPRCPRRGDPLRLDVERESLLQSALVVDVPLPQIVPFVIDPVAGGNQVRRPHFAHHVLAAVADQRQTPFPRWLRLATWDQPDSTGREVGAEVVGSVGGVPRRVEVRRAGLLLPAQLVFRAGNRVLDAIPLARTWARIVVVLPCHRQDGRADRRRCQQKQNDHRGTSRQKWRRVLLHWRTGQNWDPVTATLTGAANR